MPEKIKLPNKDIKFLEKISLSHKISSVKL